MIFIVADGTFRDKNIVDFENKTGGKNEKESRFISNECSDACLLGDRLWSRSQQLIRLELNQLRIER